MNGGTKKPRYPEIDIARGLGIILVVLGHALKQTGKTAGIYQILITVIYSFHMPFFFILSGFTAVSILEMNKMQDKINWIKKRASRLLVPYFVIGLLYIPVKVILSQYALKPYRLSDAWRLLIGENPNTALWYLYILFWIGVLAVLMLTERTIAAAVPVTMIISFLAYSFAPAGSSTLMHVRILRYFFFFVLGIMWRLEYESWKHMTGTKKVYNIILVSCAVLFVSGCCWLCAGKNEGMTLLTACTGSVLMMLAADRIKNKKRAGFLKKTGEYSMDIYIFSEPVMTCVRIVLWNILHAPVHVCTVLCCVLALLLPVPVSAGFVRRVPWMSRLLLGQTYAKRDKV